MEVYYGKEPKEKQTPYMQLELFWPQYFKQ
jgi:hypothetical protein